MKILFAAIAIVGLSGCATIVKTSTQDFQIQSTPSNAQIDVQDVTGTSIFRGATPSTVTLKRGAGYFEGASYKVIVSKTGYQRQEIMLEPSTNGWYIAGNIIFGGLIGWLAVDPSTGAMWTLSPEAINANLAAAGVSVGESDTRQFTVVLAENVPLEMWDDMVRVE